MEGNPMKQIVVFSGKGGTGKTSITASFAALAENALYADCDVDASNLHIILQPDIRESYTFMGPKGAEIMQDRCTGCLECIGACRYDAISEEKGEVQVNPFLCEGCGVCYHLCPVDAVSFEKREAGEWYLGETKYGTLVYAELFPGEENSGKLVTEVRRKAKQLGEKTNKDWCIIDGPPGTGCAVMASITGADAAVLVTEPTVSGIHDMRRALELAAFFSIPVGVVINKCSINPEQTESIRKECEDSNIPFLGEIPYSRSVIDSVSECVPYVEFRDDEISRALRNIWVNCILMTKPDGENSDERTNEGTS